MLAEQAKQASRKQACGMAAGAGLGAGAEAGTEVEADAEAVAAVLLVSSIGANNAEPGRGKDEDFLGPSVSSNVSVSSPESSSLLFFASLAGCSTILSRSGLVTPV